ncbi:hypothetical protein Y1Q_0009014 [Alligator mississippiensis]|uniref:Coiled-coil and C2 domain-containing protein 1B n=1 Tax=Alligator mississippiensis TaxID=8496 RepID=A0A151ML33_ALLMI|nr:hypothetical protein Y1Q_0009014 [Alligator mississippiensis]
MSKSRRPPPPPGPSGAAKARQMGLLVDFSPDGMMDNDDGEDDNELEAEFMAIVGGQPNLKGKPKGKTPLPMDAIERMAAFCMKDLDEEDGEEEDDLEDEDELMAELNEVLGEEEETQAALVPAAKANETPAESSSSESALVERLEMYKTAITNAKQVGDSSKVRRYERGLKTLENMVTSVRKGKKINEEEIPPPVALGKSPKVLPVPALLIGSPEILEEKSVPLAPSPQAGSVSSGPQALVQARQWEYKMAALRAKQQGSIEEATQYYRIAKSLDPMLETLGKGQAVDLGSLPPPPDQLPKKLLSPCPQQSPAATPAATPEPKLVSPASDIPPPPRDLMEALQQRMERYKTAAAQAKSKGDDRKARMHDRIVKQYQDAIRAHKTGKAVEVSELPIPPGFPPIQGMEASSGSQSIVGVLQTAMKLANQEDRQNDEEEDEIQETKPHPALTKPVAVSQPKLPSQPAARVSSAGPAAPHPAGTAKSTLKANTRAQQQLVFLEGRKKQLMQAALQAKQKNDIEGAKLFLRQAKGLDPMIEAAQNGLPVDITKVPQVPANKEEFTFVPCRGVSIPSEAASQYVELMKLMRHQHEMCMNYSKQFTHLGSIAETIKFEKMAEDCKQSTEILKQAYAKGLPVPKYHYEQRTCTVVKIFPELNSNDMILCIVKGVNLPAPPGVAPNDLDAFVRFEFPYPNAEEAQKEKTGVIKNTDSPEFKEQFKLCINRGHRGLKRILQTKGIKFEVLHKGGLFKTDRIVGTAQLKLEALETTCEVREIIELLDSRRPTGGKLEVIVRLREPLSSQQLETKTEKWLVIDPLTVPSVTIPRAKPAAAPAGDMGSRAAPALPSLNILAFDRDKLEKKMLAYKQAHQTVPNELMEQHRELAQRSQRLRAQFTQGGAVFRKEYMTQLERYLYLYTEAARRLGTEGNRDAAKEALYKRNLVESEESWRAAGTSTIPCPEVCLQRAARDLSAQRLASWARSVISTSDPSTKISGQLSPRLFRKLPPRVCVSLKNIVDEDFLCAGHIFLGFSKCGRYVLSYTSNSGDDDFSFYIYHLYWWEFNVHSKLKLVRQVRLFQDEEIYSDLYLTVCEWPSDSSKVIVFGFNTRSANGLLMNMMMMSDENHRDIYISTVAMPPIMHCPGCRDMALAHPGDPHAHCLQHGFMLHTKYQVVYPFPTFQPAFQLKKDQVVLLNTSYSLVACAVSVHTAGDSNFCQILYDGRNRPPPLHRGACGPANATPCPAGIEDRVERDSCPCWSAATAAQRTSLAMESHTKPAELSPAVARAKEFVADIFRRAKEAKGPVLAEEEDGGAGARFECQPAQEAGPCGALLLGTPAGASWEAKPGAGLVGDYCHLHHSPVSTQGERTPDGEFSPKECPLPGAEMDSQPAEPGYVNYTKLRYVLEPGDLSEPEDEYEDDKISLPFVVTDLRGRNLKPLKERAIFQGQYLTVEQLTLDFEYVINEVIRNDAAWSHQFCSFSDYDIVILEVCSETNQVIINIGLLLLAFPSPDEEGQLRPKTYHTSLKVAWNLNTGTFITVSVGDLTEVKGQTSGSVWSSYRKSCVDMVMKWLVPESSGRYVNRMTNEALHKGYSLKVLADNERYTWIVL